MSTAIERELRDFTTRVFDRRHSLIEWEPDAPEGVALVDPETARLMNASGDVVHISSGAAATDEGLRLNLAGDYLDVMQRLLESEPRVAAVQIPERYLKQKGLAEAVEKTFTWINAKVKVEAGVPGTAEYHTWWFHAVLVSEDRWEARFCLTLNACSGVEVALPDVMNEWDLRPLAEAPPMARNTFPTAAKLAEQQVMTLGAEFLQRLDARLARDRKRLTEYYRALAHESARPKTRRHESPSAEQLAARKTAVELELRRKLLELEERYAIEVTLRPVALVRAELPVVRVPLRVHRKQAVREHILFWNALLKRFEPMCCSQCGAAIVSVAFTNETVAPLCTACAR